MEVYNLIPRENKIMRPEEAAKLVELLGEDEIVEPISVVKVEEKPINIDIIGYLQKYLSAEQFDVLDNMKQIHLESTPYNWVEITSEGNAKINFCDLETMYGIFENGKFVEFHLSDGGPKIPGGMSYFTDLKKLALHGGYYGKITKMENISGLVNLEYLDLWSNEIERIEGLENLNNLNEINLTSNPLKNQFFNIAKLKKKGVKVLY